MQRNAIASPEAPAAVGPYSQAIEAGNLVFCSGQIPLDPVTGHLVAGGIVPETERVLKNLAAVLEAAGLSLDAVVKTTVFMTDLADFKAMNDIYAASFKAPAPARSTLQVAALPRGAHVEIEAVALRPGPAPR